MKISFTCINFNNYQVTLSYVKSVREIAVGHEYRIVLIDNGSAANDFQGLENAVSGQEDVILIRSEVNLGYFKGLNLGIKWALENGFLWQIVGNNDIEFHHDFMKVLETTDIQENEMIIAPDVITTSGIHENPHVVHRISKLRKLMYDVYYSSYTLARFITLFYSDERKHKPFDPERKHIYMGIGALYVLTPNFFRHFNKLRDDLFLYGEEAMLGGQIAEINGKILYEPDLKCDHNESSATSRLGSRKKYYIVKASYKIYKKYL